MSKCLHLVHLTSDPAGYTALLGRLAANLRTSKNCTTWCVLFPLVGTDQHMTMHSTLFTTECTTENVHFPGYEQQATYVLLHNVVLYHPQTCTGGTCKRSGLAHRDSEYSGVVLYTAVLVPLAAHCTMKGMFVVLRAGVQIGTPSPAVIKILDQILTRKFPLVVFLSNHERVALI